MSQCAACSNQAVKKSVLCKSCSARFNRGERVQCDGFVLQKRPVTAEAGVKLKKKE